MLETFLKLSNTALSTELLNIYAAEGCLCEYYKAYNEEKLIQKENKEELECKYVREQSFKILF
jgi:hypothetical protein